MPIFILLSAFMLQAYIVYMGISPGTKSAFHKQNHRIFDRNNECILTRRVYTWTQSGCDYTAISDGYKATDTGPSVQEPAWISNLRNSAGTPLWYCRWNWGWPLRATSCTAICYIDGMHVRVKYYDAYFLTPPTPGSIATLGRNGVLVIPMQVYAVRLAFNVFLFPIAYITAYVLWKYLIRIVRMRNNQCVWCGYGKSGIICPECGRT
jgi:hypothetical protein